MKYTVIGDLHGRIDHFNKAVHYCIEENSQLICIGDYTDSYDIPKSTQYLLLKRMYEVYQWAWKNDTHPIYLIGNHDVHYMAPLYNNYQCTGYSRSKHEVFKKGYQQLHPYLKWYFADTDLNILFTHAGLSNDVWIECGNDKDLEYTTIKEVSEFLSDVELDLFRSVLSDKGNGYNYQTKPLLQLGHESGGYPGSVGGVLWLRWMEMVNQRNKSIPNFFQIFGHTYLSRDNNEYPHTMDEYNCMNIDCLAEDWCPVVNIYEDGHMETINLME